MRLDMNLEDQVASYDLSKKLKELGVAQESLFYYYQGFAGPFVDFYEQGHVHQSYANPQKICSAFTGTELGEMLPSKLINSLTTAYFEIIKTDRWLLAYVISDDLPPIVSVIDDNECDGRAKILIYLIENNLIDNKVKDGCKQAFAKPS